MKHFTIILSLLVFLSFSSCGNSNPAIVDGNPIKQDLIDEEPDEISSFYYGADLSYVNEMEACGAMYKDLNGAKKDPFKLL